MSAKSDQGSGLPDPAGRIEPAESHAGSDIPAPEQADIADMVREFDNRLKALDADAQPESTLAPETWDLAWEQPHPPRMPESEGVGPATQAQPAPPAAPPPAASAETAQDAPEEMRLDDALAILGAAPQPEPIDTETRIEAVLAERQPHEAARADPDEPVAAATEEGAHVPAPEVKATIPAPAAVADPVRFSCIECGTKLSVAQGSADAALPVKVSCPSCGRINVWK